MCLGPLSTESYIDCSKWTATEQRCDQRSRDEANYMIHGLVLTAKSEKLHKLLAVRHLQDRIES
jgi:hypothetical protein